MSHIEEVRVRDTGELEEIPRGGKAEQQRTVRHAATRTAAVGLIHAALFLLSYWLLSTVPGPKADNETILDFYESGDSRRVVLVGLYLMPFAGIAFVWFIVSLRSWITASSPRQNVLFSNLQLVSGVIFTALFFASAAATSITAASVQYADSTIDPVVARQFPQYGSVLLLIFAIRMAALFVFSTTNMGRHARILPNWLVYLGYVVGVFLLLSVTLASLLVIVFPVWVIVLCSYLIYRARQVPADLTVDEARQARAKS